MSASESTLAELFDQWAPSYDEQLNPLLSLEERVLPGLLPQIAGADILDVGCGTGRWLSRLEGLAPASLAGIDCSPAMLELARRKLTPSTKLSCGYTGSLKEQDSSCDLILASFVLSYVDDLHAFAKECHRVLRPGEVCLVSDMHPATAAERGWKRSFSAGDSSVHLPASQRSLDEIVGIFSVHGLQLIQMLEPGFAEAESCLFERAGKLDEYTRLEGVPAIYVLHLKKSPSSGLFDLNLANAPWAVDASTWSHAALTIEGGLIAARHPQQASVDLTGYVILPGLINAHDHLEFALFPNLGRTLNDEPYRSATEWASEIHRVHADTIAQHQRVPLATRLWWGAIRNLLCGVTTVCHHNPHHTTFDAPDFPIRIASAFGWSHSLTFATDLIEDYRRTPEDQPFLLHAAEGTDAASRDELLELDRLGVLGPRTVLIHGLALGEREIALLNERGVSLILCPTSNDFLFERTLRPDLLLSIDRAAIGSDSPLTAAGDLLDEVQHLRHSAAIEDTSLFNMVITSPASMLRLDAGTGRVLLGERADLIAVRDRGATPAGTLSQLTDALIELVVVGGMVQVASAALYDRLPSHHRAGLELLLVEGQRRYIRAPIAALCHSAEQVLGEGNLKLGRREIRHDPTA